MKIFFLSYRLTLFVKLLVFNYITIVFMPNCKKKIYNHHKNFGNGNIFLLEN